MSPSSPPLGSQMLGPRDGVSIHSSRAGGPDRSRTEEPPPYLRVAPLMRRVQDLESRVGKLEYSVTDSFVGVRDELDEVWKDLGDVRKIRASPPQDSSSAPSLFQGRASYTTSTSSNAPLMPALFQQLMRQVVDELCVAGFELRTDPDARTNPGLVADALEQTIDQVSSCSRRLVSVEKELKNPDGILSKLEGRIKSLEDRRAGDAIERGGKTFRDIGSVPAWVPSQDDIVDLQQLIVTLLPDSYSLHYN